MTEYDDWTVDLPEKRTTTLGDPQAWSDAVRVLGDLTESSRELARHIPAGVADRLERNHAEHAVALVAVLQDLRRDLAQTEAYVTRELGLDPALIQAGTLPDGRAYEVKRGKIRKEWDHAGWQAQVRAQLLSGVDDEVVNAVTGEKVDVPALIAAAQAVHGSGAPKVTALKALGVDPDEYASAYPGPWSVRVTGATETDLPE